MVKKVDFLKFDFCYLIETFKIVYLKNLIKVIYFLLKLIFEIIMINCFK